MGNNKEIAKILKESLSIVDELGNLDVEDLDDFDINNYPEMEEINENLYLKEGFYVKQYDKDDYEYWTEIKAEKWIPLPQPPK